MRVSSYFEHRPGLAAVCGGLLALAGQTAFTSTFNDVKLAILERAQFPMTAARIEWVRSTIQYVPCGDRALPFQALLNEAVAWNVRITYEQEANRHIYSDAFSTDRWNDVPVIPLPCEPNRELLTRIPPDFKPVK